MTTLTIAEPYCHECGMPASEMQMIRTARPDDFDGLNVEGGMPDAICCELAL